MKDQLSVLKKGMNKKEVTEYRRLYTCERFAQRMTKRIMTSVLSEYHETTGNYKVGNLKIHCQVHILFLAYSDMEFYLTRILNTETLTMCFICKT